MKRYRNDTTQSRPLAAFGFGAFRRAAVSVLLVAAASLLSACGTIPSIAGPEPAFSSDADLAQLRAHFAPYTSVEAYYDPANAGSQRKQRDQFIVGRLIIYDVEFARWASQFALTRAEIDSILDITKLALDGATAGFGSAYDKSILGAISTLLGGSRLSIEKNFFDQNTAHALIAEMIAQRKAALVKIRAGMALDVDKYTFEDALGDTNDYYTAGTLEGALQGITEQAGQKAQKADADLKNLRESKYVSDSPAQALMNWLWPGYVSTDASGNRLDKNGTTIARVDANWQAFVKWKAGDSQAKNIGMGDLLSGDQFAAARARAVAALKIGK